MRKVKSIFVSLLFILGIFLTGDLFPFSKEGEKFKEKIVNCLIGEGLENIRISDTGKKVIVAYEDRINRFEITGIKETIKLIVPLIDDREELILIPMNRKIPLLRVVTSVNTAEKFIKGEISQVEFARKLICEINTDAEMNDLEKEQEFNSSTMKTELILKPALVFEFGPFQKPVMGLLTVNPDLRISFWKGMNLDYEVLVPVWNEFGSREDSVRPGKVTMNQVIRFPDNYFLSTSLGVFSDNRYGFDMEIGKYFFNGDFYVSGNLGATSYMSFSGMKKLFYYDKFTVTGFANCEYRFQEYDLTIGVTIGKFLMSDNSIRFDINRQFGEVEVGFFTSHSTEGISNGGIIFSIPLWPAKHMKPGIVRLRSAENYTTGYMVKSNLVDKIGLMYNTGNKLKNYFNNLNPGYIKNFLTNYDLDKER